MVQAVQEILPYILKVYMLIEMMLQDISGARIIFGQKLVLLVVLFTVFTQVEMSALEQKLQFLQLIWSEDLM